MEHITTETIGLFVTLAGFVIGLGAVTVIDIHGFLGRKSGYWNLATTRTHKVTKPLIWIGISLVIIGGFTLYMDATTWIPLMTYQLFVIFTLIINGLFLSFHVSPYLLRQEKAGHDTKLLPAQLQTKITLSFIVSFIGWWSLLFSLVWYLMVIR